LCLSDQVFAIAETNLNKERRLSLERLVPVNGMLIAKV